MEFFLIEHMEIFHNIGIATSAAVTDNKKLSASIDVLPLSF